MKLPLCVASEHNQPNCSDKPPTTTGKRYAVNCFRHVFTSLPGGHHVAPMVAPLTARMATKTTRSELSLLAALQRVAEQLCFFGNLGLGRPWFRTLIHLISGCFRDLEMT